MRAGAAPTALEWTMPEERIELTCDQLKGIGVVLSSPSQEKGMKKLGKPVVIVNETTTSEAHATKNHSIA